MNPKRTPFLNALRNEPWAFTEHLFESLMEMPMSLTAWLIVNALFVTGLLIVYVALVGPILIIGK